MPQHLRAHPKPLMRKQFKDIPQGSHFKDLSGRKFIKIMRVLPSGTKQTVHRRLDDKETAEIFNAIDYYGCLARCPEWFEFYLLKQPKSS